MKNFIHDILRLAVQAPSGHNYQPWRFLIEGDMVHVYNIPERDTTLFNFNQSGSLIAHGALLENIVIASAAFGYNAQIQLFPNKQQSDLTASISFKKSSSPDTFSLAQYIPLRATNRKPYKKEMPLQETHRQDLLEAASEIGVGEIRLVEEKTRIASLAATFTLTETLVLQNFSMHQSLFPHILWSSQENEQKKLGLYLKTLELPPPGRMMFRILKNWKAASILAKIGLPKAVAKQNQQLYASSSAIGVILMRNKTHQDFIAAGRVLQRMWLKATKNGLSVQPVTGLLYLAQRISSEGNQNFTERQKDLIESATKKIAQTFNVTDEVMMITFRVGYGERPSAHAKKLPPEYTEAI